MGKVSKDVWKFFLFPIQPKCFLGFQNSLCHPLLCSWPLFLASPELERWVEVLNQGSEHLLSSQLDLSIIWEPASLQPLGLGQEWNHYSCLDFRKKSFVSCSLPSHIFRAQGPGMTVAVEKLGGSEMKLENMVSWLYELLVDRANGFPIHSKQSLLPPRQYEPGNGTSSRNSTFSLLFRVFSLVST